MVASSLLAEELPSDRVPGTSLEWARKESGPIAENGSSRNFRGKERKAHYKEVKQIGGGGRRRERKRRKEENTLVI